jgi:hypothetical protein
VASRHQIHCVNRSDRLNHHQRLRAIGGVNPDGAHWKISEAQAISAISKYGGKYLNTALDGLHPESLLALPECS